VLSILLYKVDFIAISSYYNHASGGTLILIFLLRIIFSPDEDLIPTICSSSNKRPAIPSNSLNRNIYKKF
jgi:hypothetical protein